MNKYNCLGTYRSKTLYAETYYIMREESWLYRKENFVIGEIRYNYDGALIFYPVTRLTYTIGINSKSEHYECD